MAADLKVVLAALLRDISEKSSCENLAEAKAILSATRAENIYNVSKDLDLSPLFSCSSTFNGNTLDELSELLGKLLDAFPPSALLSAHKQHFVTALSTSHGALKAVVLRQLIRCSKDNATVSQLARDHRILESVLRLLGSEDLWSSKQSAILLKQMTREKEVLSAMLHPPVAHVLDSVMDGGDVCRFRVFEVFVDVAKASPENLERLSESGHLERLVKEMDKNDVLVQLNALEVLTELVSCSHGLDYLERTGIISKLRQKALNIGSDPLGNFLGPGVLKFFGSMGVTSPQRLLLDYPQVLGFIFESVQSDDPACQVVAAETVGIISSTIQGKRVLQSHGDQMSRYLKTLSQNIHSGKVDFKVRYLGALANVLHVQDSSCEDLVQLTERWYSLLGDRPTDMLLRLCRQPFPELRCATLTVVAEVARLPWGQAALAAQPGFLEYLLDRSTEADKQCKEAKFAVVATLAQMQPRGFADDDWQRIRTAYQEGPFYMASEAAVTFEGLS
ncbi:26S proteasome non-ATPase regulatory subunit 5 [Dermacentor variabilis]|uniref:26S proteasome non-ATPase regulatory subunit 5 n=1 Tax=Dermacentor variabilis TaxID=34621 RepID=UPI003F5B928C